jgi:hypothetical protein
MMKSAAAVRAHRRSRSGGKELESLSEDGVVTLDNANNSAGLDLNR